MTRFKMMVAAGVALLLVTPPVYAESLSAGDTAWMMTATALVLMMTLPGLFLFYGGMVRSKNLLSVGVQCFACAMLVTVLWFGYGYSLALTGTGALIGGFDQLFLSGMNADSLYGTIPEPVFMLFQMTFAIITPALFVGALVERIRFPALLLFVALWFSLVYVPVCHWVWGESGWLEQMGVIDFAGGTVVHINAGIAGLVGALVLGVRRGYPRVAMPPNNLTLTMIGAAMLWVGWFGFNAGSELAANGVAGMAMVVTQIAAASAALSWMALEWIRNDKPTALGIASGVVAGLVAITPASGSVGAGGAFVIGVSSGVICYWFSVPVKRALGYDDSLDVFGVHAVGGITGALLTGVFAAESLGGSGFGDGIHSIGAQLAAQGIGVAATMIYSGVASLILLGVCKVVCGGLRVSEDEESRGLDTSQHGERAYNL